MLESIRNIFRKELTQPQTIFSITEQMRIRRLQNSNKECSTACGTPFCLEL